jgi:hypothetical protein
MPNFFPHPDGVELNLDPDESRLLKQLTAEYGTLLRDEREGEVRDRLFPSAYEDEQDEAAYRDLIGDSLEQHKREALETVTKCLSKRGRTVVKITGEDFDAWLQCITDMRLAIGTRLGVDEERMAEHVSPRDPDANALAIIHWLAWLTEGLIETRGTISPP